MMKYSEAKAILEQQEKAKAAVERYKRLSTAHTKYGFKTRRDFIEALRELDGAKGGRKAPAAGRPGKRRSGGGRGLSGAVVNQIKTMKAAGKTNAEISRVTKVSPLTVAKYVKGVAAKATSKPAAKKAPARRGRKTGASKGRGISTATVAQIKAMKAAGKANAEISRVTKVSPMTVAKYVKGIPAVKKPAAKKSTAKKAPARKSAKGRAGKGRGLPPQTVKKIKSMKADGKSNALISRTTKVSPMTVAKYVKGA